MSTFLLDTAIWDLVVDAAGGIAVADDPYAQAQDAASEIRLFQGECYYDVDRGVPYFGQVLGRLPPTQLVQAQLVDAALLVVGVTGATCDLTGFTRRRLSGRVQVTNAAGQTSSVGF